MNLPLNKSTKLNNDEFMIAIRMDNDDLFNEYKEYFIFEYI